MSISDFITKTFVVLFVVGGLYATVKMWRGDSPLWRGFYERPDPVTRFFNNVYGVSPLGYVIIAAGALVMVLGLVVADAATALGLDHLLFIPILVIVCMGGAGMVIGFLISKLVPNWRRPAWMREVDERAAAAGEAASQLTHPAGKAGRVGLEAGVRAGTDSEPPAGHG